MKLCGKSVEWGVSVVGGGGVGGGGGGSGSGSGGGGRLVPCCALSCPLVPSRALLCPVVPCCALLSLCCVPFEYQHHYLCFFFYFSSHHHICMFSGGNPRPKNLGGPALLWIQYASPVML